MKHGIFEALQNLLEVNKDMITCKTILCELFKANDRGIGAVPLQAGSFPVAHIKGFPKTLRGKGGKKE